MTDLPVKRLSARLVLTDPMYHRDGLDDWDAVAEWSSSVLQPNGLFFAFTGTQFLPDVLARVSKHLTWENMFTVKLPRFFKFWRRDRLCRLECTRAAVLFVKGKRITGKLVKNLFACKPYPVKYHEYQLPLDAVMYFMERFTNQGDLVVDPMAGSWTTGIAAHKLHRNYIGGDIDPACREIWERRLREGD
jgi:site-specific DNA-methyltransferase (adenine-specific)